MILFIAIILVSSSFAEDDLRQILTSPKATLNLYRNFKAGQGLTYSGNEDRLRLRLFRDNAAYVADLNEHKDTATYALNFFSSMTKDEKKQYLGLNITGHLAEEAPVVRSSAVGVPSSKLWTNIGAVTEVKNQGSCGSCWAFAAVGSLETRYQQGSGKLRNFAEQEYLDCVYVGARNLCATGGWHHDAYEYSQRNGGRLAATANYNYMGEVGSCAGSSKPDAMLAMKIRGLVHVPQTEAAHIETLVTGTLSVGFEVTNKFSQYRSGIMRDTTCTGRANHAVTAVGYTPSYILVKNSWGSNWGDSGFVKFARNYYNCDLFKYSSYPILEATGESDATPSDPATDYRAQEEETPECRDVLGNCNKYERFCFVTDWAKEHCAKTCQLCEPACKDKLETCSNYTKYCHVTEWAKEDCAKTCDLCGSDDGECAPGTIRCSDGVCRHEHMCH